MASTGSAESRLPLKELELLVLLAVYGAPLHGYALLSAVAGQSNGFIAPGPASLYRTIAQLFEEGLLEEAGGRHDDDPRRRYFQASMQGRAVARAELKRLAALLTSARAAGVRFEGGAS